MPEVADISKVVPNSSENGKTGKALKSHGKTAIDEKRQCYPLRFFPSINRVMQVRDHQFIRRDFSLRRIPLGNVA